MSVSPVGAPDEQATQAVRPADTASWRVDAPTPIPRSQWRGDRFWIIVMVVLVLVAAVLPLPGTPRFYFYGDTQAGAFGQWYHLGSELLGGRWPLLDPQVWRAGNFVGEGQWGLFSPLTMLLGLLAVNSTNVVVFVTAVKLALLVTGASGTYALARTYAAPPWASALAGLAVTAGGATRYLESPSWVTGQMIWALLPVFWCAMRRTTRGRANPVLALLTGLLIVSVGYVYGCLFIGIVALACIVEAVLRGNHTAIWRTLLVTTCCALLAITVYLPGLLTASVTVRSGFEIESEGRLEGDLLGTLTGILPFGTSSYVAWFIPLLAFVRPSRVVALMRSMAGLYVFLGIVTLWLLGPNQVGPIRWPARIMPEFVLPLVVVACVLLSRAVVERVTGRRVFMAATWTLVAGYLILSRHVPEARTVAMLTSVVLAGVLLAGTAGLLMSRQGRPVGPMLGIVALLWTIPVLMSQYHAFPLPASVDRNMPALVSDYKQQAAGAVGDVIVVGDMEKDLISNKALARDFLIAGAWFVNPHEVQNTYTTIGFSNYNKRYCLRYNGTSCAGLLKTLFSEQPETGVRRVDLLSVSSIYLTTSDFSKSQLAKTPSGWRVSTANQNAVLWVRDQPVAPAGGVVWSSPGLLVTPLSQDDRGASFRVDKAAPNAKVVLSRLAWPGYVVTGAMESTMTDGYLLSLDVSKTPPGTVVTVHFAPPGWAVERATLAAALLLGVSWPLGEALLARRKVVPGTSKE